ncbi:MAG: potassium transporter TrkA [Ignavibacteriae bacterium]|nr:MAG: potassium transporter TrkA [Ignavibacteriota bacterium]
MNHTIKFPLITRLRYKFDNQMSAGVIALIGWLAAISLVLIIIAAIILTFTGFAQEGSESVGFIEGTWQSLMRTLDPGTMGQDTGWGFRLIMLFVTVGGIFIVSTLIGVLSSGISSKLDDLRKGHSFVVESGHTLILGWSEKIIPIISELIIANVNQKKPRIVILANRDKVEMEDDIRTRIPDCKNTKIICRNGSVIDLNDLEIVNPHEARSIIILAENETDPDIHVIKTILALTNNPNRKQEPYHIVAEISDAKNKEVAEMVGSDEVILVHSDDLISRVIAQTCRQSGLSIVYTELLDFDGAEIYFQQEPGLAGKTFKDAVLAYEDSTIIGLRFADGRIQVNPPMDTIFSADDKVIAISEDDDTVKLSGKTNYRFDESVFSTNGKFVPNIEKTLILGWNKRACSIIRELDNYLSPGSSITIVTDEQNVDEQINKIKGIVKNQSIKFINGVITERSVLEPLPLADYNHIILLCYSDTMDIQESDSRTLITLLHLRNISERENVDFSIVSEMMDIRNKQLAEVTKADDFIISNKLVSLMLSQLSENKELKAVFDDLFDAEGSEIYLKPASHYIKPGKEVDFYEVSECAARRNEIVIGYRKCSFAHDADKAYGVFVNPKKSDKIIFEEIDKLIVIAED